MSMPGMQTAPAVSQSGAIPMPQMASGVEQNMPIM